MRLPAIVLMLAAGLIIGPVLGLFDPARDIGPITGPLISLAVAVILFEGGLTLDVHKLGNARSGVMRLVVIGAPLGWLMSTLALRYGAGLSWESCDRVRRHHDRDRPHRDRAPAAAGAAVAPAGGACCNGKRS